MSCNRCSYTPKETRGILYTGGTLSCSDIRQGDSLELVLSKLDSRICAVLGSVSASSHTHANKALLDTYTQTEVSLADAVAKKHSHTNSTALDNVSGINTGDETSSSIAAKLSALSGSDRLDAAAIRNIPAGVTITDNLTTTSSGTTLDARQGFILKGLTDSNTTAISNLQAATLGVEQSATYAGISSVRTDIRIVIVAADETAANSANQTYLFNGQTKIGQILLY